MEVSQSSVNDQALDGVTALSLCSLCKRVSQRLEGGRGEEGGGGGDHCVSNDDCWGRLTSSDGRTLHRSTGKYHAPYFVLITLG